MVVGAAALILDQIPLSRRQIWLWMACSDWGQGREQMTTWGSLFHSLPHDVGPNR